VPSNAGSRAGVIPRWVEPWRSRSRPGNARAEAAAWGHDLGVRRSRAVLGSAAFAVVAPGTMIVVVPWLLTGWHTSSPAVWSIALGSVLIAVGGGVSLQATARFVLEGHGTPAPNAAPEQLVVGGLYRYVRNPMYLAIVSTIAGEALVLGRPILFAWAAGFWLVTATWVRVYEEPTLAKRFGDQYISYRSSVPPWLPRLRPWSGGPSQAR